MEWNTKMPHITGRIPIEFRQTYYIQYGINCAIPGALYPTLWEEINVSSVCFNQKPQSVTLKINHSRETQRRGTLCLSAFTRNIQGGGVNITAFKGEEVLFLSWNQGRRKGKERGVKCSWKRTGYSWQKGWRGENTVWKSKGQSWNVYLGFFRLHE